MRRDFPQRPQQEFATSPQVHKSTTIFPDLTMDSGHHLPTLDNETAGRWTLREAGSIFIMRGENLDATVNIGRLLNF